MSYIIVTVLQLRFNTRVRTLGIFSLCMLQKCMCISFEYLNDVRLNLYSSNYLLEEEPIVHLDSHSRIVFAVDYHCDCGCGYYTAGCFDHSFRCS